MSLRAITKRLVGDGFDIVHPFPAHAVATDPAFARLHDPRRPVGVLVGNTRALWPMLNRARRSDPSYFDREQPVDGYTAWEMGAIGRLYGASYVFAHCPQDDGTYLPFQRLAVAVGLAALAPSQLLIHPTYGPWFALRAVLLLDGTPPRLERPVALPCRCVEHGCVTHFEQASAHPDDWRAWLAVRDACPIGREHRYDDDQIAYHYTKDRRYLPVVG